MIDDGNVHVVTLALEILLWTLKRIIVLFSRMTVIKLMEPFHEKTEGLRKCVLTSLIKQHIGNNSDLVCFCWHFCRKI